MQFPITGICTESYRKSISKFRAIGEPGREISEAPVNSRHRETKSVFGLPLFNSAETIEKLLRCSKWRLV